MQLARLLILALATAALSLAADVTGKWTGSVDTNDGVVTITLNLKADGESLTGSIVTHMGEMPIKEGKVTGDEVNWLNTFERDGNSMKIRHKGKINGAEMKVTVTVEGREERTIEYTAKKAS